jgi:hypothetical protein
MSEDNRVKLFLILGFILLLIVALIVYSLFKSNDEATPDEGFNLFLPFTGVGGGDTRDIQTPTNQDPFDGFINIDTGQPLTQDERARLVQLSTDPVIGIYPRNEDQQVAYFKRGIGHVFTTPFDGSEPEERSIQLTVPNIIKVEWASDGKFALLTSLNDLVLENSWVNFTSTTTTEVGIFSEPFLDASFSPDSKQIVTFSKRSNANVIRTSTPKGTGANVIHSTVIPDYEVEWISPRTIALKTRTSAFAPSLLQIVRSTGGSPIVLSSEKNGFDAKWDPEGFIYVSSQADQRGRISSTAIYDSREDDGKSIEIGKTLPEKCIFSSKFVTTIYCGFPQNLGSDPLPDAWYMGNISFNDLLVRYNYSEKTIEVLLAGGGFDFTDLVLSEDEDYIFFINKKDSTPWSLKLPSNLPEEIEETNDTNNPTQ